MQLSKKQIKRIKRQALVKSTAEIAAELSISESAVVAITGKAKKKITENTKGALSGRILTALLAIVLAGTPLVPLLARTDSFDPSNLPQMLFIRIGILAIMTGWFVHCFMRRRLMLIRTPIDYCLLAVLGWSTISLIWAVNKYTGIEILTQFYCCWIIYYLTLLIASENRQIDILLHAILFSGFVAAGIGVMQYLFNVNWIQQTISPASTFGNKNMAAQFMILTWPVGAWYFVNSRRAVGNWCYGLITSTLVLYLFYTFTKSCWLAATIQGAILVTAGYLNRIPLALKERWTTGKTRAACTCLAALFIMLNVNSSGFSWQFGRAIDQVIGIVKSDDKGPTKKTTLEDGIVAAQPPTEAGSGDSKSPENRSDLTATGKDSSTKTFKPKVNSLAIRLGYWRNTIELIKDHPVLGVGIGNFKIYYPRYANAAVKDEGFSVASVARSAHNDYLHITAELGLIGLLIWGALLVGIVKTVYSGLKNIGNNADFRGIVLALISVQIGILVVAAFSFPLKLAIPPFLFMTVLGCIGSLCHQTADTGGSVKDPQFRYVNLPRQYALIGIVISGSLLILGIRNAYNNRIADIHYGRMSTWDRLGEPQAALDEANQVLHYNPWRKRTLFFVSKAHEDLGDSKKSVAVMEQFRRYYPNHMPSQINLTSSYIALGRLDDALKLCNEIINTFPGQSVSHALKGQILVRQGKLDESYQEYRKAIELGDITRSEIYFNYANVAIRMKKYQEAKQALLESLRLQPTWYSYDSLGLLQISHLGEIDDGIANLKKALKISKDPEIQSKIQNQIKNAVGERAGRPSPPGTTAK